MVQVQAQGQKVKQEKVYESDRYTRRFWNVLSRIIGVALVGSLTLTFIQMLPMMFVFVASFMGLSADLKIGTLQGLIYIMTSSIIGLGALCAFMVIVYLAFRYTIRRVIPLPFVTFPVRRRVKKKS